MINGNRMNEHEFQLEICSRCETMFELRRRESLIKAILEKYPDIKDEIDDMDLKFPLGSESVKENFKTGCTYIGKCEDIMEMLDIVVSLEEKLSKLMYYMMNNGEEKEVYYISSDICPYYPMLSNRIIRCNRLKENVMKDRFDTKKLIEEFRKNKD